MKETAVASDYPLGDGLEFLQRLWQLNHALERVSAAMERSLGVSAQQRFMLRCLGRYPGLSSGQLARLLHLDPGTVSATLGRLESKRLIERRRDPKDQRRVLLGLTAAGRRIDRQMPGTVEHVVERVLERSTRPEQETALRVLERLSAELHAEVAGASATPSAAADHPATTADAPRARGAARPATAGTRRAPRRRRAPAAQ